MAITVEIRVRKKESINILQGKAVIMVEESKKNFYKKFLYEPFPVESSLGISFSLSLFFRFHFCLWSFWPSVFHILFFVSLLSWYRRVAYESHPKSVGYFLIRVYGVLSMLSFFLISFFVFTFLFLLLRVSALVYHHPAILLLTRGIRSPRPHD